MLSFNPSVFHRLSCPEHLRGTRSLRDGVYCVTRGNIEVEVSLEELLDVRYGYLLVDVVSGELYFVVEVSLTSFVCSDDPSSRNTNVQHYALA